MHTEQPTDARQYAQSVQRPPTLPPAAERPSPAFSRTEANSQQPPTEDHGSIRHGNQASAETRG